jgi:hypothetical protein
VSEQPWAVRISKVFGVKLSSDVQAWFDAENLPGLPLTTFDQPINPSGLLDPTASTVWGGQMLPDTLPVLGDGFGNALCLRFGFDGSVSEVIHWDHEGGSWMPYGRNLAEALILDASFSLINQLDDESDLKSSSEDELFTFADWGVKWISSLDASLLRNFAKDPNSLLSRLSEFGVAQVAIAQRECREHLTTRLDRVCRQVGGGKIAKLLEVDWAEFRRWIAAPQLIPQSQREALATITTFPFEELVYQDWDRAASKAQLVLQTRKDLAWPFAVLGRYGNAQHKTADAARYYAEGLRALGTSEDFTAAWSVLFSRQTKFIPQAFAALKPSLDSENETYLDLFSSPRSAKDVRVYWINCGEQAERNGQYELACRCYYAAGWDIPVGDGIEEVLERLEKVATRAGYCAPASLARYHRLSLSK